MTDWIRLLMVGVGLWAAGPSLANLTIEVNEGTIALTPIAIVPFANKGVATFQAEEPADIISNNLLTSGLFRPLAKDNMLSLPSPGSDIYFSDWKVSKTDYLVIGSITTAPSDKSGAHFLILNYELHDVVSEKRILSGNIRVTPETIRDGVHIISNKVFKSITGIRGVFGSKILYVTDNRSTNKQPTYRLMMADHDGARPKTLLTTKEPLMSPTWSPDAKQIAYVSFENGKPEIYRQELTTGQRERLTSFSGINGSPNWSPDGESMAMVLSKDGNPEIYVLNLKNKRLRRMTNHFAIDTEPNWATDGRSLLFTSDRGGQPQIYRLNIANKQVSRVTFQGDYNARARLSQDGRFLVLLHGVGNKYHIAVLNMQTERLLIVTETNRDESPTIAPNGAMVMYATKVNGREILGVSSLDAGVRYNLPGKDISVREPAWAPIAKW